MAEGQTAIWLAALWLIREVAGLAVKRVADRAGKVGCDPDKCGFYLKAMTDDGRELEVTFLPNHSAYKDQDAIPLTITAQIFNETDTPIMLTGFQLQFWGVRGPAVTHRNPEVRVSGQVVTTLKIAAHDATSIQMIIMLRKDQLDSTYAETVPLLLATDVNGKKHSFRVGKCSFHGEHLVVWHSGRRPYPNKFPTYNDLPLNPTYTTVERFMVDMGLRLPKPNKQIQATGVPPAPDL